MTIINSDVVSRDFLGLADLMKIQAFCIQELTKIMMVSKDENLVFAAFYIVVPSLKGFHNSQKLQIVSFIASLFNKLRRI